MRAEDDGGALRLVTQCDPAEGSGATVAAADQEALDVDLVISATGYQRTAHVGMLQDLGPPTTGKAGGRRRRRLWTRLRERMGDVVDSRRCRRHAFDKHTSARGRPRLRRPLLSRNGGGGIWHLAPGLLRGHSRGK